MADPVSLAISVGGLAWSVYQQVVLAKENSAAAEELAALCCRLEKLLKDAENSNWYAATPATFLHDSLSVSREVAWIMLSVHGGILS